MKKLQCETHAAKGLYQRGGEQATAERDWSRDIPTFQDAVLGTVASQKHRSWQGSILGKRSKREGGGALLFQEPAMGTRS